ncbi:SPOR domain-containing protein [bacterium]|nr:SPOR domain-containing protein [bacterium]
MIKRLVFFAALVLLAVGCTTKQTVKSDKEYQQALEESEKNKDKKLDFLANEKLPNEEYLPSDSASPNKEMTEFQEVLPANSAKYRIQIFAGSPVNASKNFSKFGTDHPGTEVYMINDKNENLWKIWVGGFNTKHEADSAKQKLIESGYPDSWVSEMKASQEVKMTTTNLFWVQVGSFQNDAAAQKIKSELESKQTDKVIIKKTDAAWKVWVGGMADRTGCETLKKKIAELGYQGAFIVQGGE